MQPTLPDSSARNRKPLTQLERPQNPPPFEDSALEQATTTSTPTAAKSVGDGACPECDCPVAPPLVSNLCPRCLFTLPFTSQSPSTGTAMVSVTGSNSDDNFEEAGGLVGASSSCLPVGGDDTPPPISGQERRPKDRGRVVPDGPFAVPPELARRLVQWSWMLALGQIRSVDYWAWAKSAIEGWVTSPPTTPQAMICRLTHLGSLQIVPAVAAFVCQLREKEAARKISESGLLLPFSQHKPDRSEEQPHRNKRQKTTSVEDDPAAMVVTRSVGALNTGTKADVELTPATMDTVCTTTKSTSEEANPESEEQSAENNSSKDVEQIQELKAALGAELPLDKASDPASTHRCLLILQRLLKLSFSETIQSSGVRTVVKKFRNHPSIGKLADRILIYWFLDRETRQWRQALDKSDVSKVEVKVAFFYLQVEKHCCLSVELMDRLSLRSLVEDTAALFESSGHRDGGFLERLERLTYLQK